MSANNGGYQGDGDGGDVKAAEYVLRLLPDEEQERLRAAALSDPDLAASIAEWEERFASFAHELEPVTPPEAVLRAVQDRIGDREARQISTVSSKPTSLWNSLPFWRGVSIASLAAASIMAVMLLRPFAAPPAVEAKLVATLNSTSGSAAFVAAFDPGRKQMILVPASMIGPETRVPELWLVPPGGKAISLGVIDPSRPQSMIMPDQLAVLTQADAAMVITLEPVGGAPGGVATGPVIARGTFSRI